MKTRFFFGVVMMLSAAMISCTNDSEKLVVDNTGPDQNWYSTYTTSMKAVELRNELNTDFFIDSTVLNPNSQYQQIPICNQSMLLTIPRNSITYNNIPYYGDVVIKSKFLTGRGQQVSNLKNGKTTDGKVLQNCVSVYLGFYKTNNEELYIGDSNHVTLHIHCNDANSNNNTPKLYLESTNNLLSNNWTENTNPFSGISHVSGDDINVDINRAGWFNISRIYNISQTNPIALNLPPNYTNANTIAYISLINDNVSLQMDPSVSDKHFKLTGLPVGRQVKVVVLSKQGNSYFMGSTNVTVSAQPTPGFPYQQIDITPTITTISNIRDFLSNF